VTPPTATADAGNQVRKSPVYESNAREIALDPVNKLIDDIIQTPVNRR
jgi:membrane fusion protein (multidrug efflux system)